MTEIERLRKENGYTQQFMADEIDSSIGCYNMYENNQRKIPRDKAILIAKVLKCKLDDICVPSNFTASEIEAKEINN